MITESLNYTILVSRPISRVICLSTITTSGGLDPETRLYPA